MINTPHPRRTARMSTSSPPLKPSTPNVGCIISVLSLLYVQGLTSKLRHPEPKRSVRVSGTDSAIRGCLQRLVRGFFTSCPHLPPSYHLGQLLPSTLKQCSCRHRVSGLPTSKRLAAYFTALSLAARPKLNAPSCWHDFMPLSCPEPIARPKIKNNTSP